MNNRVTLYRKAAGWTAVNLEGVSVCCGHSRAVVDKKSQSSRRGLGLGEIREKRGKLMIPKAAMPVDMTVEPGDLILLGEGPKKLTSPSELKELGKKFLRVQSVEDHRQDEILPHLAVIGC